MDELNMMECSCLGNNPDCYKCGGKGYTTKSDLIPDYKKYSYPSRLKKRRGPKRPLIGKAPQIPSILLRLEMKILQAKKTITTKPIDNPKPIAKTTLKKGSQKLAKKSKVKGQDVNFQHNSVLDNTKNGKTIWSTDQLLMLDRIKEDIKETEPRHKVNQKSSIKKSTHKNPYKMRGKNLSGTVHKNKPLYDDKMDHKLDGAKDYWQYRERGKYGSYPDFDDMGEEANP